MKIEKTKSFIREFNKLPSEIQKLFVQQEKLFVINWPDPRLHTKRLKELSGVFSFRITRRYRVLFYFQESQRVIFFTIGHRKEVYK